MRLCRLLSSCKPGMIYRKALTSELSNTAGGAFTVLFSIVVTIGLVRILNQTAGGRYDTGSILEVVAYTSLINLPALISLALFLAVFMTLNRYWRDSEMFVWFSAGGLSLTGFVRFCALRFRLFLSLPLVRLPFLLGQELRFRPIVIVLLRKKTSANFLLADSSRQKAAVRSSS